MNLILISLAVLGITGLVAAVLLYFIAQKFKVEEDPRIDEVQDALPGANCGGCGFAGCRALAEACVKADSLEGLNCPVGGAPTMAKVGEILGMAAPQTEPKVAVIRCNGTCEARPKTSEYSGERRCDIIHSLYTGETGCRFGCLGCGDCVKACQFGALSIDPETGLPVVDEEKCTACGKCVQACPRHLIELRNKGPKGRRMVVLCRNEDKGAATRKDCKNGCIGCGKCAKECKFDAITIVNNVAYIDFEKCKLCRKCEAVCPVGAIHAINFPPRPQKPAEPAAPKAAAPVAPKAEAPAPVAPKAEAPAPEAKPVINTEKEANA